MYPDYTSLTLNGKDHSSAALLQDSENFLKSVSAPGWQKKIHIFIGDWLSPSTHLDVVTSGSTGTPRVLRVSKETMVRSALRTGEFLGLKRGDKALLCLPMDYIAGKMMVVRSFVLGLDLITVYPSLNPLQDVEESVDFIAMTPMQVHHVLDSKGGREKLNKTRVLIIGGGEMDPLLSEKTASLACLAYHTYGMTETLTHIAVKRLTGHRPDVGYNAFPGVFFEKDERNCLVISDPLLGIEKMGTNDLVELLSPSEFRYLGRMDNVINTGGIKIMPEVIEGKLQKYLDYRIVLAGKKDKILGEKLILIVELKNSKKPVDIQSVLRNASLEKYEKPREIYFMDFFPESSSGKILREKLLTRIGTMKGRPIKPLD